MATWADAGQLHAAVNDLVETGMILTGKPGLRRAGDAADGGAGRAGHGDQDLLATPCSAAIFGRSRGGPEHRHAVDDGADLGGVVVDEAHRPKPRSGRWRAPWPSCTPAWPAPTSMVGDFLTAQWPRLARSAPLAGNSPDASRTPDGGQERQAEVHGDDPERDTTNALPPRCREAKAEGDQHRRDVAAPRRHGWPREDRRSARRTAAPRRPEDHVLQVTT